MGEIIKVNFITGRESEGYIIEGRKIQGVYCKNIVASKNNDHVYVGEKYNDSILNPISISIEDMNRFCLMWLCIFDESVIKKDI